MFGYVTVYKNLISEDDYLTFRSYYCGLCKAIGHRCSHAARLGLSYDITFLALVLSSVLDDEINEKNDRCIVHPLNKRKCITENRVIDYAADMGVILSYLKLLDDWKDEKSIKALFGLLVFRRAMKNAEKRNGKYKALIVMQLNRLSSLEKQKSGSIDECADCFAKILEMLFTPDFITGENEKRILAWFGYNIGRWIYVIDAINDMKQDRKTGAYNPFNVGFQDGNYDIYVDSVRCNKKLTLALTLENAASSFELMDIKRNRSLIHAILYDCLKARQSQILYADKDAALSKGKTNESI